MSNNSSGMNVLGVVWVKLSEWFPYSSPCMSWLSQFGQQSIKIEFSKLWEVTVPPLGVSPNPLHVHACLYLFGPQSHTNVGLHSRAGTVFDSSSHGFVLGSACCCRCSLDKMMTPWMPPQDSCLSWYRDF